MCKIRREVVAQLLVKATDEKLKNNKNKFLYLNWIEKIVRYWNYIICVIFKVYESKCIFYETYVTSLMFNTFIILKLSGGGGVWRSNWKNKNFWTAHLQ